MTHFLLQILAADSSVAEALVEPRTIRPSVTARRATRLRTADASTSMSARQTTMVPAMPPPNALTWLVASSASALLVKWVTPMIRLVPVAVLSPSAPQMPNAHRQPSVLPARVVASIPVAPVAELAVPAPIAPSAIMLLFALAPPGQRETRADPMDASSWNAWKTLIAPKINRA